MPPACLRADEGILLDHIGRALDPVLDQAARATMADCPHYRWLGGLAHGATRQRIQRAHVLVHPSRMEGGAHVIMEAALSGTPVLASRVPGNVGMLGVDYAGYFAAGRRCGSGAPAPSVPARTWPSPVACSRDLQSQCEARAALFEPAAEKAALLQALSGLRWPAPASSLL